MAFCALELCGNKCESADAFRGDSDTAESPARPCDKVVLEAW